MTRTRFARLTWLILAFNLAVVLWGSVVRATGSGAGCGSHWPRCDGSVVPTLEDAETAIEFVHRATSGVALAAVVVLALVARRLFPAGHRVRLAATAAAAFIVVEALIGALLVAFGWVEDDTSIGRIVTIAVHLANTFLLLAALTATAWWAGGAPGPSPDRDRRRERLLGIGMGALIVVGGLGAVTALGDTLFPPGEAAAESARAQFLIQLRVIHPVLAVVTGIGWAFAARLPGADRARPWPAVVAGLVAIQIGAGALTIALKAPLWMQVVHLLLADLLWIAVVLAVLSLVALPRAVASVPGRRATAAP